MRSRAVTAPTRPADAGGPVEQARQREVTIVTLSPSASARTASGPGRSPTTAQSGEVADVPDSRAGRWPARASRTGTARRRATAATRRRATAPAAASASTGKNTPANSVIGMTANRNSSANMLSVLIDARVREHRRGDRDGRAAGRPARRSTAHHECTTPKSAITTRKPQRRTRRPAARRRAARRRPCPAGAAATPASRGRSGSTGTRPAPARSTRRSPTCNAVEASSPGAM